MNKPRKFGKKTWIIIGVAVVIACVVFYGATRRHTNGATSITFTKIERGDIENTISSTGALNAKGTVEVGTQVSGTIDKVYVDYNDHVSKNQILAVLDSTLLAASVRDAQANLLKTQAQYDLSLAKYEDAQELYEQDFVSEIDYKTAETDYAAARAGLLSAQATLERAKADLKYAVIRSPINGTVIDRSVEPGQTVAASFSTPTLFVIAEDLYQMEIHAYVDESDIGQIKEGQPVRFTVDAFPDETFTGTVRQIRLQPETIDNVVNYTVVIDATNDNQMLLPGMTATVDFLIQQRTNVLFISNSALHIQPTEAMLSELRNSKPEKMSQLPDSIRQIHLQEMRDRQQQGESAEIDSAGQQEQSEDMAMLWYYDADKKLNAMPVRTGITDGKHTEILESSGIQEGMEFINGVGQQGASETASSNNQQNRPPRIPHF
jgi:HlyD family secretion protein